MGRNSGQLQGNSLPAGPGAIAAAQVEEVRIVTTDAVKHFGPVFFHAPFHQQIGWSHGFRTLDPFLFPP
jgi:hypothetical protein